MLLLLLRFPFPPNELVPALLQLLDFLLHARLAVLLLLQIALVVRRVAAVAVLFWDLLQGIPHPVSPLRHWVQPAALDNLVQRSAVANLITAWAPAIRGGRKMRFVKLEFTKSERGV